MANPPRGGNLHKAQLNQGLGKSTLVNPNLSIPMPPGAATPPPSTGQNQGKPANSGPPANGQGAKSCG
jgi:hypothetical protein